MTANVLTVPETRVEAGESHGVGWVEAWFSSWLILIFPRAAARRWTRISLQRAGVLAAVNLLLALPWMLVVLVCGVAWGGHALRQPKLGVYNAGEWVAGVRHQFLQLFMSTPKQVGHAWLDLLPLDRIAAIVGPVMLLLTLMGMVFFILLPLAARPGSSKACARHVVRVVLLGTGLVHMWGAVMSAMFLMLVVFRYPPDFQDVIVPVLIVMMLLLLSTLGVLAYAASREYRTVGDYPVAHDPTCDQCGYNLVAAAMTGRCPECGKPVAESLGDEVRRPTAWEDDPRLARWGVIRKQLAQLVTGPRELFFSMPTLTGQAAARRWLFGSLVLIGATASLIVPSFSLVLQEIDGSTMVVGGLSLGVVWALLGLMMVGIETAGIATFSKMKGTAVSLATAAKVTSYATPLMIPWVILGGAQLLAIYWWDEHYRNSYGLRIQQIVFMGSLTFAHVGGLLWYELTVYRGIRGVQFANR